MFIWLCTTCPIGKHYKPKFIESIDPTLKPIPGRDLYKANQICYNNYLPPYVIDQHHMKQPMAICLQLNDSDDSDDRMTDTTSKLYIETKEFVKDHVDYLISSCDAGCSTINDYYTLHDELKFHLSSEKSSKVLVLMNHI